MQVSFLGPTYNGRSKAIDPSRCINLYPELSVNAASKSQLSLVGTPGALLQIATGAICVRGTYNYNNLLFIVADNHLYTYDGLTLTSVGTLSTSVGRVSIRDNGLLKSGVGGNQLIIVDGKEGYIYDISDNTFTTISRDETGYVSAITITEPGAGYQEVPEVVVETGGTGEDLEYTVYMGVVTAIVSYPGHGYKIGDVLEIGRSGLTAASSTYVQVKTLLATRVYLEDSTTGLAYVVGEVLTCTGGTFTSELTIRVDAVDGAGGITAVSIIDPGSYTQRAPVPLAFTTSGAGGGAYIYVDWGVETVTVLDEGKYTRIDTGEFTQTTTAAATALRVLDNGGGYTLNDVVAGVGGTSTHVFTGKVDSLKTVGAGAKTVEIINPGTYTSLPSNPVALATTSGTGSGATVIATYSVGAGMRITPSWGVSAITVQNGGSGYPVDASVTFTTESAGGVTTAQATATITENNGGFPDKPVQIVYIDGYFIVVNSSMGFWSSDLFNGLVWNPLARANAMSKPGDIIGIAEYNSQLVLLKSGSGEAWYDAGVSTSTGSPFARTQGVNFNYGCIAPWSVANDTDFLFMLTDSGVVQLSGYDASIISTPPITYRINRLKNKSQAVGWCYIENGHHFYVITFPKVQSTLCVPGEDGNATFVYDRTSQMWHERSTYSEASDLMFPDRHLANTYTYWNNKHIVSDYRNGNIYEQSEDVFTDNGDPIIRSRIAPVTHDKQDLTDLFFYRFYIDAEVGTADPALAVEPSATLSWSVDGGYTWSNEYPASMGLQGKYMTRLIWRRIGNSFNMVFRLAISDPIRVVLVGSYADVSK